MEKMTNKIALGFVLGLEEVKANKEVFDKLTKMLEQVEKKSNTGKTGKPTKVQMENELIKDKILQILLESETPLQIKEMLANDELSQYSNQKLSALVRQLVAEEKVVRIEEKKVAKFSIK